MKRDCWSVYCGVASGEENHVDLTVSVDDVAVVFGCGLACDAAVQRRGVRRLQLLASGGVDVFRVGAVGIRYLQGIAESVIAYVSNAPALVLDEGSPFVVCKGHLLGGDREVHAAVLSHGAGVIENFLYSVAVVGYVEVVDLAVHSVGLEAMALQAEHAAVGHEVEEPLSVAVRIGAEVRVLAILHSGQQPVTFVT